MFQKYFVKKLFTKIISDKNYFTCNSEERHSREDNRSLSHSMNGDILGTERLKELEELLLHGGGQHRPEIGDVCLTVVEVLQQLETVSETSKDGELSLERILPVQQSQDGVDDDLLESHLK